jgi:hypothetical protein
MKNPFLSKKPGWAITQFLSPQESCSLGETRLKKLPKVFIFFLHSFHPWKNKN